MHDRLEELRDEFVARDYEPYGIEREDEHDHGHPGPGDAHPHHGGTSSREFVHRGHRGQIRTTYEITIDGEPWEGPIAVLPDGNVVSHYLPQYIVPSAVDLVRVVIDQTYEAPEEVRAAIDAAEQEESK